MSESKKRRKHPPSEEEDTVIEETAAEESVGKAENAPGEAVEETGVGAAEQEETAEGWRDKYLRTLAELDNFRKRTEREREQARRYALEEFLRRLLPVLDALQLATGSDGDPGEIRQGVSLALSDLMRILSDVGVEEIEGLGEPFDPRWHEAVGMVPAEEEGSAGTIVKVERCGYRVQDRVLRPSRVHVAVKVPEVGGEAGDAPEDTIEEEE